MLVLNIVTELDAGVWLPERESNNARLYNTWIKKVWIIASTTKLERKKFEFGYREKLEHLPRVKCHR
jgi:hypothetical protein